MQQPITRQDVYTPSVSATIGGRQVDVVSMSVDRSMPDPVTSSGLRAADVSVSVADGEDVSASVATPWDPGSVWPPVPETAASVTMGTGAGPVSVLAGGRVVSASGGTGDRAVSVELADRYQSLDKTISWEPVAEAMPSLTDSGLRRFVGMWAPAVTDQILRHCGWYCTPPIQGYSVLSVPAQGSLWPERGVVATASDAATGVGFPRFGVTPWGVGTMDADALYQVTSGYTVASRGRIELSAMVSATEGTGRLTAYTGTGGALIRLAWSAAQGSVWIGGNGATPVAVATVPISQGLLYATVEYISAASVRVILRSGGESTTVTATVASAVTSGAVASAGITVDGARSAGFQIAFPGSTGNLLNWTANAQIHERVSNMNRLTVRPGVESESCVDLLAQQCEAQAATYWIDETGVLHWWDLATLEARGTVATLTSQDEIGEGGFTWSHDLSSVKSGVTVEWVEAAQRFASTASIDLWQGSGSTLQPGTTGQEEIISVPDDEVWLMPDTTLANVATSIAGFNAGVGSFYGAVTSGSGSTADEWAHLAGTLTTSLETITGQAFKLTQSWTGSAKEAIQRTPGEESSSDLWRRRRDVDLPIIRGKSKVTLTDRSSTSTITGPSTAAELVIDAGWWIQSETQALITADYYANRVTVPGPVLSSVSLIPIPGLQIGDIVMIRDEDVTRLAIRGIVTDDSRVVDADMGISHTVTVRPLEVTRIGVTWAEWGAAVAPKTWRDWYLSQQSTWAEWGADPLASEED